MSNDISDFLMKLKRTNIVNARLVLTEYYQQKTKIYNYLNPSSINPLASVSFHDAEDNINDSMLEDAIKKYVKYDIYRIFGLSLIEYLSLPLEYTYLIRKVASTNIGKKAAQMDDLEKQLKDLTNIDEKQ